MKNWLIALSIVVAGATVSFVATAQDVISVVYHIDDADAQGIKGLRNIRNHLDVAPQTKIRVVTHANGVDFLMDGARDKSGKIEYASLVSALVSRGVVFEVCEITLKNRNLKRDQFVLEANFTPSGVARLAELQAKQKFAYIKP
ncbi:DsrE family protein [Alcaligenaceae bacterium LF4-65]|jgi:intracellular sulfur oxidation DsrE/DsrF family protein|uniref:DsrE family protein n=1 Tax=Zwartia hollandica TaxID=324606 RepID=A0A953N850_9BURK|nr:DsrE family protein [Zwartia hollandica]MBZ1349914.1 DsrE family protein [Zwartia hollandica]